MNTQIKKVFLLSCLVTLINSATFAHTPIAIDTLHLQVNTDVDTVGPVVSAAVYYKHINLKQYESSTQVTKAVVFPKSSELSVAGNDRAGIREIYISMDNATELPYKDPIRLTARGRHTAHIRAVDNAGNETIYSFTYVIRD